jgi:hypothetical protein
MVDKTRVYNWYVVHFAVMERRETDGYRYCAMVAAGCMVLYGYDAAVFNTVQTNTYWLAWFNTPVRLPNPARRISTDRAT